MKRRKRNYTFNLFLTVQTVVALLHLISIITVVRLNSSRFSCSVVKTRLVFHLFVLLQPDFPVDYQRWSPRGHILKFMALASKVKSLASKPQVLENCPVLGSKTALFFEPLKVCWKTPETSRKICEHLFFLNWSIGIAKRAPPQLKFHQ